MIRILCSDDQLSPSEFVTQLPCSISPGNLLDFCSPLEFLDQSSSHFHARCQFDFALVRHCLQALASYRAFGVEEQWCGGWDGKVEHQKCHVCGCHQISWGIFPALPCVTKRRKHQMVNYAEKKISRGLRAEVLFQDQESWAVQESVACLRGMKCHQQFLICSLIMSY